MHSGVPRPSHKPRPPDPVAVAGPVHADLRFLERDHKPVGLFSMDALVAIARRESKLDLGDLGYLCLGEIETGTPNGDDIPCPMA